MTSNVLKNAHRKAVTTVRVELVRQARDNQGLYFSEIAKRMQVSVSRVQQLYRKAQTR